MLAEEVEKMRYRWMIGLAFAIILLFTPLSSGDWLSSQHDFQNTNSTDESGPEPPLKALWKEYVGGWDDPEMKNPPPVVHGNYVYMGHGCVIAINKTTGKVIWINSDASRPSDILYYRGVLYTICDRFWSYDYNRVVAINATTGKTIWVFSPESGISYNGYILNNKIVIVTSHKMEYKENNSPYMYVRINITFLNLKNGEIIKNVEVAKNVHDVYAELMTAYGYGNIYIQTKYHIFCVNLTTLKIVWSKIFFTAGYMRTNLIVGHGKVFVATPYYTETLNFTSIPLNTTIVAMDAFTGKDLWKFVTGYGADFGTMFSYSPKYDVLFTYTAGGHCNVRGSTLVIYNITAVNCTSGKVIWSVRDPKWLFSEGSIVPTSKWVYIYSREFDEEKSEHGEGGYWMAEAIRIYNITDGKSVYRYVIKEGWNAIEYYYTYPQISISNDVIYLGGYFSGAICHGRNLDNTNSIETSLAIGIIGIGGVIGAIFVIKKRKNRVDESHRKG